MDESASRQIEDLKDEIRGLTRALEVARELIPADAARNQEALEWIARQFCDRTDDADKYVGADACRGRCALDRGLSARGGRGAAAARG